MDYLVFLSYTRNDANKYLEKFVEALRDQIYNLYPEVDTKEIIFQDTESIPPGAAWPQELKAALNASRTMVCMYSPRYFRSYWCGREWAAFYERCAMGKKRKALPTLPHKLIPVIWNFNEAEKLDSLFAATDDRVRTIQFDAHQSTGVEAMLQRGSRSAFNTYVRTLAERICLEAKDAYSLPTLEDGKLNEIESFFPIASRSTDAAPADSTSSRTRHVRFVFAAARPEELDKHRSVEPYLDHGRGDWKPFYPGDDQDVASIVQHIASDRDLRFSSDELPLDENLTNAIAAALRENKIVAILVDPWSLQYNRYREIFKTFDQHNYQNCTVLLPWTENDPQVQSQRDVIASAVLNAFHFRKTSSNPIYFRDGINSRRALEKALREILTTLQANVRNRAQSEVAPGYQFPVLTPLSSKGQ